MDIKESSPEDLLWALRLVRPHPDIKESTYKFPPGYVVFLGAGASVEAGIPTAYEMVVRALRSRRDQNPTMATSTPSMSDKEIEDWAREKEYYDPNDIESMYAQVMDKLFNTPALREEFVRRELRKARVSSGYQILGELIARGVFDTILTPNFDQLVRQGADVVLPWPIEEVNSVEQYLHLSTPSQDPRIVRLHGDFWHSNLRNTTDELRRTPKIIYDAVRKLFGSGGLIVIGYGGEDASLMQGLFPPELWQDPDVFRSGLYWCDIKEKEQLAPRVKAFLTEGGKMNRASYVKIEGFNKLLEQMAHQYNVPVSLDEGDMLRNIRECWEWLALLPELIINDSGSNDRGKHLTRLVQLLGSVGAVCVSRKNGSAGWEVTTSSGAKFPKSGRGPISESVAQLHRDSRDYERMSASELSEENVFYEFLKAGTQIESFPVWRKNILKGLVSFASSERPLISRQPVRLIRAAVQLLIQSQGR
jgi:hypothetical protein